MHNFVLLFFSSYLVLRKKTVPYCARWFFVIVVVLRGVSTCGLDTYNFFRVLLCNIQFPTELISTNGCIQVICMLLK